MLRYILGYSLAYYNAEKLGVFSQASGDTDIWVLVTRRPRDRDGGANRRAFLLKLENFQGSAYGVMVLPSRPRKTLQNDAEDSGSRQRRGRDKAARVAVETRQQMDH